MLKLIKTINLILLIAIFVTLIGIYDKINQTNDNMKAYTCDGYALDQDKAPNFCI